MYKLINVNAYLIFFAKFIDLTEASCWRSWWTLPTATATLYLTTRINYHLAYFHTCNCEIWVWEKFQLISSLFILKHEKIFIWQSRHHKCCRVLCSWGRNSTTCIKSTLYIVDMKCKYILASFLQCLVCLVLRPCVTETLDILFYAS